MTRVKIPFNIPYLTGEEEAKVLRALRSRHHCGNHPFGKRCVELLCKKYGFHMIRHPFAFLRYLIDFSFEKLEKSIQIAEEVTPDDAPEVEMPVYYERGMESIKNTGIGMYMEDPLTTANLCKVCYN